MPQNLLTISPLRPGSDDLAVCARWRHEAFFRDGEVSLSDSYAQLQAIVTRGNDEEVALVVHIGGDLAGICLLVLNEIDPLHAVSPWLASLYVAPPFRLRGVARALIRAIEDQARRNGVEKLYLYTVDAAGLYESCGWIEEDRADDNGVPVVLMSRALII